MSESLKSRLGTTFIGVAWLTLAPSLVVLFEQAACLVNRTPGYGDPLLARLLGFGFIMFCIGKCLQDSTTAKAEPRAQAFPCLTDDETQIQAAA